MPEQSPLLRLPAEAGSADDRGWAPISGGRKGAEGLNIWDVMHGNIDKNLLRLHDAQAKAE